MGKVRMATVWLDGCSGCHMSFLDIDERILALAERVELVYSPLVDTKAFPDEVDVTLVEGAVASDEDLAKIRKIRAHTKLLISLGDCAVTGNVPAMRNPLGLAAVTEGYGEALPTAHLPRLLERVYPVHQVVEVDIFVPGCPPSADRIYHLLSDVLEGKLVQPREHAHFGD